jgi:hypothetical protein
VIFSGRLSENWKSAYGMSQSLITHLQGVNSPSKEGGMAGRSKPAIADDDGVGLYVDVMIASSS